jgi:hypothetical protein
MYVFLSKELHSYSFFLICDDFIQNLELRACTLYGKICVRKFRPIFRFLDFTWTLEF